jgi:hypothetical protein
MYQPPSSQDIAALRFEHELARLDREWDMEREQYMVIGKRGHRSVPTPGQAVAGIVFACVWTLFSTLFFFWTIVFPLFGIYAIVMSIQAYQKAVAYQGAQAAFQQRRAEFIASQGR